MYSHQRWPFTANHQVMGMNAYSIFWSWHTYMYTYYILYNHAGLNYVWARVAASAAWKVSEILVYVHLLQPVTRTYASAWFA